MTHVLSIEPNGLGVVITFSGLVNRDEIYNLNEQLMSDESFSQWRYQIWDFSNVEKFDVPIDQLRSFAIQDSIAAAKNPNQKIAIIPRQSPRSGLDSVFHVYEEVWAAYESRSFSNVDAARAWATSDQERKI
ncbi:MAG: hypothetical protein JXR84_00935 [Anaerolineae bacterium]|nr:hypothetical protein [Anaerolineae bacterium]